MRLGPIELYKKLPKTNCGDCGQPSCLAFATQVVGFGQELGDCPHLDETTLEEVARTIEEQRDKGIFVKKDTYKITREHLREKIGNHDFEAIAPGLGLTYKTNNGMDALEIPYFERVVTMSRTGIVAGGTEEFDPWDEDKEEGFGAQAKILFDATALDYLDLEGLTFVAEKLADKLTSI